MNTSSVYIIVAIAIFAVLVFVLLLVQLQRKPRRLSPLVLLSFSFVLAGIFFGEERWLGYSLIGAGIVLAVADIIKSRRRKTS